MNFECENEDYNFIQEVLRRHFKDPRLVVDRVKCELGSAIGYNFMSVIKRATVSGKFNGTDNVQREFRQSLIIKRQLQCQSTRETYQANAAFRNEINAYSTILPILSRISFAAQLPYPKCLFSGRDHNHQEVLILEDLKLTGHYTANRLKSLNFQQCSMVMRRFAHLHATSMVLRIVDRKEFDRVLLSVNDYMFVNTEEINTFPRFFENAVVQSLLSMRTNNQDRRLDRVMVFFEKHLANFKLYSIAQRLVTRETDENLMAICHGDSWKNNFMFRETTKGLVADAKLIDLQVMRYTSPTIDLLHFLYSSTDTELRMRHYDDLMDIYQRTLLEYIESMAAPHLSNVQTRAQIQYLKAVHSVEQVKERMHKNSLYGLAQFILLLPIFTYGTGLLVGPGVAPVEYHQRLRETLLEFEGMGVLRAEFLGEDKSVQWTRGTVDSSKCAANFECPIVAFDREGEGTC